MKIIRSIWVQADDNLWYETPVLQRSFGYVHFCHNRQNEVFAEFVMREDDFQAEYKRFDMKVNVSTAFLQIVSPRLLRCSFGLQTSNLMMSGKSHRLFAPYLLLPARAAYFTSEKPLPSKLITQYSRRGMPPLNPKFVDSTIISYPKKGVIHEITG